VPTDGDVKNGKIFYNGNWVAIKEKKVVKDNSKDKPCELKFGSIVLKGIIRPKHFENCDKDGYTFWFEKGQPFVGNGNIRL